MAGVTWAQLHPLPSVGSSNERSNRRDTRQTKTKRRRCLSDGPNVTDLRAAACERQAWHAGEQRGPGGWSPVEAGKTGLPPLTRRPSASAAALTWNARRLNPPAAGLLSALCIPVGASPSTFVYFHSCICAECSSVCLSQWFVLLSSFIHKTLNGHRYTLLFSLYPSPLTSCVPVVLLQIFTKHIQVFIYISYAGNSRPSPSFSCLLSFTLKR